MKVRETHEVTGGFGGRTYTETRVIELPDDATLTDNQEKVANSTPVSDWTEV